MIARHPCHAEIRFPLGTCQKWYTEIPVSAPFNKGPLEDAVLFFRSAFRQASSFLVSGKDSARQALEDRKNSQQKTEHFCSVFICLKNRTPGVVLSVQQGCRQPAQGRWLCGTQDNPLTAASVRT